MSKPPVQGVTLARTIKWIEKTCTYDIIVQKEEISFVRPSNIHADFSNIGMNKKGKNSLPKRLELSLKA